MDKARVGEMRKDWLQFADWWTTYSTMTWDEWRVMVYGA